MCSERIRRIMSDFLRRSPWLPRQFVVPLSPSEMLLVTSNKAFDSSDHGTGRQRPCNNSPGDRFEQMDQYLDARCLVSRHIQVLTGSSK